MISLKHSKSRYGGRRSLWRQPMFQQVVFFSLGSFCFHTIQGFLNHHSKIIPVKLTNWKLLFSLFFCRTNKLKDMLPGLVCIQFRATCILSYISQFNQMVPLKARISENQCYFIDKFMVSPSITINGKEQFANRFRVSLLSEKSGQGNLKVVQSSTVANPFPATEAIISKAFFHINLLRQVRQAIYTN